MPSYPNRCQHLKVNGTQCGSPALRRNRFCYFHKRHHEERIQLNADREKSSRARRRAIAIDLPVFEDANSIQVSLMQITRLLISGNIDSKTAGLVLYALQTASSNLHRTRFEPDMRDVILDPASVAETALGARIWEESDFIDEDEDDEDEIAADSNQGIDPARQAGIMKAAEFLYELDRKNSAARAKKPPAHENTAAEVREQVRQQIVNAAPALLAAVSISPKESRDTPP